MLSKAIIHGYLTFISRVNSGYILHLKESSFNKLNSEPIYHCVSVWGKKAQHIKLHKGKRYEITATISYRKKDGTTYTNFTLDYYKIIEKKFTPYKPPPERDDDWYVPEPRDRDAPEERRYECF